MATPPNPLRVLFVDDEDSLRLIVDGELTRLGHTVVTCADLPTALDTLSRQTFDAAILDVMLGNGQSGLDVLRKLKEVSPDTEVVMMTGYPENGTFREAMRLGALDYLHKPLRLQDLDALLRRIADKKLLTNQNKALEARVQAVEGQNLLIGNSPAMQQVRKLILTVAGTDATVLVTGETGTGKELVARTIFLQSKRHAMPFVPVNCGALSPTLVESELFGHRKGAFTGADRDHKGLFEVADGGTLFLDELGELDRNIQVKLLRFLESGEQRRLGDTTPNTLNVRVICATNRDLAKMISEEEFREDLLYRLNTFEVRLPPLRERKQDIPELARHLLARSAKRTVPQATEMLSPQAIEVMFDYDWMGNVREVANAMEYAFIVSGGAEIGPEHLPQNVRARRPRLLQTSAPSAPGASSILPMPSLAGTRTLHDIEMEHILRVLEKNANNKPLTAKELGISLKTLYNKLNRLEEDRSKTAG